jgi:hypothetical protein
VEDPSRSFWIVSTGGVAEAAIGIALARSGLDGAVAEVAADD